MRPLSIYTKYAYYLSQFGTAKKLNNIRMNRSELRKRKTVLKSVPYQISIDPGNFCNLRCPGCHTGIKHSEMIKPAFLSFKNYQTIFDQLEAYALTVALYNWGEPFLNKELFSMIDYSRSKQVGSTLHSNLNVFNEQMAINCVKSGLTHLYISLDGAGQDSYEKYRVKGQFDQVIEHIRILLEVRKRLKSKWPRVTWKFLVFEHNQHEVEIAKKMAYSLGVDSFESFQAYPQLMDIYDEAKQVRENPVLFKEIPKVCSSLWSKIYIHADGSVFPCSLAFRESESFGNMLNQPFREVWNNDKFRGARSMFTAHFDQNQLPLPCHSCKFFINKTCSKLFNA